MKLLPFGFLLLLFSCSTSEKTSSSSTQNVEMYKKIAHQRWGKAAVFSFSPQKSYVLCKKAIQEDSANPNQLHDFFVVNLKTKSIDYEDKIHAVSVDWINDYNLKIVKQRGISLSPLDSGKSIYLYNMKTKKTDRIDGIKYEINEKK